MKRLLAVLLCMLLCLPAAAETFDQAALEQLENCEVYLDVNGVDTIVRPTDQPWMGETELEDSEVMVFLDYVQIPDEDATLLRLTLSVTSYEFIGANQVTISAGGKDYVFSVFPEVSEYDMTYFEDYITCLTDESLPLLRAMARSRTETFDITLAGAREVHGSVTLDLDAVAEIYNTYVDLGGTAQDLEQLRELWPVMIIGE